MGEIVNLMSISSRGLDRRFDGLYNAVSRFILLVTEKIKNMQVKYDIYAIMTAYEFIWP